jgi:hypothetical protein
MHLRISGSSMIESSYHLHSIQAVFISPPHGLASCNSCLQPSSISQLKTHGRRECASIRRRWQFRNFLASFSDRIIHHRVPGAFNNVEFRDRSIRFHLEFNCDLQHFSESHLAGRLVPGCLKSIRQYRDVTCQCRISRPAALGVTRPCRVGAV